MTFPKKKGTIVNYTIMEKNYGTTPRTMGLRLTKGKNIVDYQKL